MTDQQVELSIRALNCKINRLEAEVAQGGGGTGTGGGAVGPESDPIALAKTVTVNGNSQTLGSNPNFTVSAVGTVSSIGVNLDGGGSVLTTGQKGYIRVPFNATINGWSIIARENTGTATFDVWKAAGTKPTVGNSITASAKPAISATDVASSTSLGTWGTGVNITAGDIIGWNLDSVTVITWAVLQLTITKV